jgi:hypothetical protein
VEPYPRDNHNFGLNKMTSKDDKEYYEVPGYGKKHISLRHHWINVSSIPDEEMYEIDRMEDNLKFKTLKEKENIYFIRRYITRFEKCHHKALQRLYKLILAIGRGKLDIYQKSKKERQQTQSVQEWKNAWKILEARVKDSVNNIKDLSYNGITAHELMKEIGTHTPLKEWQVQRLADRIHGFLTEYNLLDDEFKYHELEKEPQYYQDNPKFYNKTKNIIIHDTLNGKPREWPLTLAIDLFNPCNWNHTQNLFQLLKVINGKTHLEKPLIVCIQDFDSHPNYKDFLIIEKTLRAYWDGTFKPENINKEILKTLGQKNPIKFWLVRSLEKTLKLIPS